MIPYLATETSLVNDTVVLRGLENDIRAIVACNGAIDLRTTPFQYDQAKVGQQNAKNLGHDDEFLSGKSKLLNRISENNLRKTVGIHLR